MDGELGRSFRAAQGGATILVVGAPDRADSGLTAALAGAGYIVRDTGRLAAAYASMAALPPALVILDGPVEGADLASLCRALFDRTPCPILAIDQGADMIDRVLALELGADDVLSRPLHDRELIARVKALLRRGARPARTQAEDTGRGSCWTLNPISRELAAPGCRGVMLTPSEQSLLATFLRMPGRPLSGIDNPVTGLSENQLRTYVLRLRRKLKAAGFETHAIRSLRTRGYLFDETLAGRVQIAA